MAIAKYKVYRMSLYLLLFLFILQAIIECLTSVDLRLVKVLDGKLSALAASELMVLTWRGSHGGRGERGRASLSLVEGSITSL